MTEQSVIEVEGGHNVADLIEAIDETVETMTKPITKRAKPKAKSKAPATASTANSPTDASQVNTRKRKETPSAPSVTIAVDGQTYELKEGVDAAAVEAEAAAVADAVAAIAKNDSDLLPSYMALGKFASSVAPLFKSTKLYGQFLAAKAPASTTLDPALRSNCKWLYEALNVADHEGADILSVLGVNRIEDYKSSNPTVIKRAFKEAQKKADKLAKAAEKGFDTANEDEAISALTAAEKKAEETKTKREITKAVNNLIRFCGEQEKKEDALSEVADMIKEMLNEHKGIKSQVDFLAGLK